MVHEAGLRGRPDPGDPGCEDFRLLWPEAGLSVSSSSPNRWPLSDPFLIFCFPVNFKIELNCKLEFDPLLFLALKKEVWARLGSRLLLLSTFRR